MLLWDTRLNYHTSTFTFFNNFPNSIYITIAIKSWHVTVHLNATFDRSRVSSDVVRSAKRYCHLPGCIKYESHPLDDWQPKPSFHTHHRFLSHEKYQAPSKYGEAPPFHRPPRRRLYLWICRITQLSNWHWGASLSREIQF